MTLILGVTGSRSIWMLADRRLSYPQRPPKEDGQKIMILEAKDGVAMIGYAGLGATALGTEPAHWMTRVLRGRNFSLEHSLGVLAKAIQDRLPAHLVQTPQNSVAAHNVIIPALVGKEPRFYSIDLVFAPDRRTYQFRYRRLRDTNSPVSQPRAPRVGIGGTGAQYLLHDRRWFRELLRIIKVSDRGKVSRRAVANYLANLNQQVYLAAQGAGDESVGPRCIVACRIAKDGNQGGGGEHQCYTGGQRDPSTGFIPTITHGADLNALAAAIMPHSMKSLEAMLEGKPAPEVDTDAINEELKRLPREPDEELS
ncbi:hypothetical protein [Pelagibius sp.]|uniref:hypothetical protein n=1 Tax=Pelagibius sp. TaxID=1931238 RepID=UPI00262342F8|nr:hypothetical protein [Pelagibius sp.]